MSSHEKKNTNTHSHSHTYIHTYIHIRTYTSKHDQNVFFLLLQSNESREQRIAGDKRFSDVSAGSVAAVPFVHRRDRVWIQRPCATRHANHRVKVERAANDAKVSVCMYVIYVCMYVFFCMRMIDILFAQDTNFNKNK